MAEGVIDTGGFPKIACQGPIAGDLKHDSSCTSIEATQPSPRCQVLAMNLRRAAKRPAVRGASIGVACALLVCALSSSAVVRTVENYAFDECLSLRGNRHTDAKIILISIDSESLRQIGKPLVYIAPELVLVVQYLNRQRVAIISIDVLIPESAADNPAP